MDSSTQQPSYDPRAFTVVHAAFALGLQRIEGVPESDVAEIAFAGRSNVGKSSLLNTLMARRNLVRTSSTPGCTRQINVFDCKLADGLALRLVDLPGFGYAKRSKDERAAWAGFIEQYLQQRQCLRAVAVLVDARRGMEEEEQMLLDFLRAARGDSVSIVPVATKLDKLSRAQATAAVARLSKQAGMRAVGFSARTGAGREELWKALRRLTAPAP